MIKSFNHKGLKVFFETGSAKGIRADHAEKIHDILYTLNNTNNINSLNNL